MLGTEDSAKALGGHVPALILKQQGSGFGLNREGEWERVEDKFEGVTGETVMEGLCIDFGFCSEENKKQSEYFEQRINFI